MSVPEAERQTVTRWTVKDILDSGGMFDVVEIVSCTVDDESGHIEYIGFDWLDGTCDRWRVVGDWDAESTHFSIEKLP